MEELIGMRAKLYSIKVELEEKGKDANIRIIRQKAATAGSMSHIAKKHLNHHLDVFNELEDVKQHIIRSKNRKLPQKTS